MIIQKNGTVSFKIFSKFPELVCQISTRKLGDLDVGKKSIKNISSFLLKKSIPVDCFVGMKQTHSANVEIAKHSQGGQIIENTDGIITQDIHLYLGVNIADCVPLFLYDPVQKVIGVIHAGWKGTLANIVGKTVRVFQKYSSNPKNILVAIGPHVGGCCYNVNVQRANLFKIKFSKNQIVFKNNQDWYIDLAQANKSLLIETGIFDKHIECPITCTSCQNDVYFSYRKERNQSTFGEMLGIIGMRQ